MVLDDETTVVERLKEFLEDKGMSVETFTDSSQAVARLADKQFDVVVTDLMMKGPTGLECARYGQATRAANGSDHHYRLPHH